LQKPGIDTALYLLFIFFSNRFLGSFGFFVLETLTAKQINLQLGYPSNGYKVLA
jgi:hypothetical protein